MLARVFIYLKALEYVGEDLIVDFPAFRGTIFGMGDAISVALSLARIPATVVEAQTNAWTAAQGKKEVMHDIRWY